MTVVIAVLNFRLMIVATKSTPRKSGLESNHRNPSAISRRAFGLPTAGAAVAGVLSEASATEGMASGAAERCSIHAVTIVITWHIVIVVLINHLFTASKALPRGSPAS